MRNFKLSTQSLIFWYSTVSSILISVGFYALVWRSYKADISREFERTNTAVAALFRDTLYDDLARSYEPEIFRKCKTFFENQGLLGIRVSTGAGHIYCELGNLTSTPVPLSTALISFSDTDNGEIQDLKPDAKIEIAFSWEGFLRVIQNTLWKALVLLGVILLINYSVAAVLARLLALPVKNILRSFKVNDLHQLKEYSFVNKPFIAEFNDLYSGIHDLSHSVIQYQKQLVDSARDLERGKIAAQVEHDIRSPLAALKLLSSFAKNLDPDELQVLRSSISTMAEIASDLNALRTKTKTTINIVDTIEIFLKSKRFEMMNLKDSKIDILFQCNFSAAFVTINAGDFIRALNNLVNNAIEAIQGHGSVRLSLEKRDDSELILVIRDNGKGMSTGDLEQLGRRGFTSGKVDGSGLGFHFSKTVLEEAGSSFVITSEIGVGTEISARIPLTDV